MCIKFQFLGLRAYIRGLKCVRKLQMTLGACKPGSGGGGAGSSPQPYLL